LKGVAAVPKRGKCGIFALFRMELA
jgi:hypothetical protein